MTRRIGVLLSLIWYLQACAARAGCTAPSVLNEGTHAATFIAPAINAVLGAGHVDTDIPTDRTADGVSTLDTFQNTSGTPFFQVATNTATNHAVYCVLNASISGYDIALDQTHYALLVTAGTVHAQPYSRAGLPAGTPPPLTYAVSSSVNSGNGGSGPGIEWGLSAGYKGLDTSADSWVSAATAGFLAALKFNHPTWNYFDIKAALRQTAANWSTGYNANLFGYGVIDWDAANAIASPNDLYLQPPQILATISGATQDQLLITVYPYRQTRRAYENVYVVPVGYTWPVKNEYTQTDIDASGATLIFTSLGSSDITPSGVANLVIHPGTYQLIPLTSDGLGHFSRVESFSSVSSPTVLCL